MRISQYLREEFCVMDLSAQDKEGAIRQIARKMSLAKGIVDEEKFINDVLERESLGSTGIGNNVAIPHARTQMARGFVIGFGRSKQGVEFQALDGAKVNLVFLMGSDPKELNLYLRLLAELSKLLMNNGFREALINAQTPKDIMSAVKQFEVK